MSSRIAEFWKIQSASPFPPGCRGQEVAGVDLVLLDSTIAGCVSTYLNSKGCFDLWYTAILGLCYRDVTIVASKLEGEAQGYFGRWEELIRLVLEAIRDSSQGRVALG